MANYYTPPHIIVSAKSFFGGAIDLDLCSDPTANTIVEAGGFLTDYTQFDPRKAFGLSLWCNPPYERDFISKFFCDWYVKNIPIALDNGCEILTLVNTQSSARWFHSLLGCSNSIGFFKKRISFIDPDSLLIIKGNRYDQSLFMSSGRVDAHTRLKKAFAEQVKLMSLSYMS